MGAIAISTAADGHSGSNLNRLEAIGLTWRTTGTGAIWARGQLASAKSIDFLAIISANALPGTSYRLRLGATQAQVDVTAPI